MGVINELSAGMTVRDEDKAFIAQVYSYAFVGLMLDWIKDEMKRGPGNAGKSACPRDSGRCFAAR